MKIRKKNTVTDGQSRLNQIERILGNAAFSSAGIRIYNIDCVNAMKSLPEGCIDLTVTSPPYNIGKEYEKPLSLDEYLDWSHIWVSEVARITASTGAFWFNLGYVSKPDVARAIPLPYLLWNRVPLFLIQEVVWNYGAGVAARLSFSPRNEKFLWYVKDPERYTFNLDEVRDPDVKYPNQKKNGKLKCNPLGKNPSDVWNFPKVTSGANRSSEERTDHPAQFPEAVIERIIEACSNPGDLVLDPFMGSGTTAAVARKLGRLVVGFELLPRYIDVARARIENDLELEQIAESQVQLFGGIENQ